jgi:glutaminyl-peptide cyclotransferase
LETVPHDGDAYTQGLQTVGEDTLYECVGHYGKSELRRVDLLTGTVLQRQKLADEFFGEGITYYKDPISGKGRILQLTWREGTAFLYDSESLELLDRFSYDTETGQGWGITWRPKESTFIVSDGSSFLHTWESQTFAETKRTEVYTMVHGGKGAVRNINELEYEPVSDTVLANVWFNDLILRIDPDTGFVTTMYDLRGLYPPDQRSSQDKDAVLNGIALVPGEPDQVWVTGKLWSHMFRIRLIDPDEVGPTR